MALGMTNFEADCPMVTGSASRSDIGIETNDDDEWRRVLDVNVVGLVKASRAALPALRPAHNASIVNIASAAATAGLSNRALLGKHGCGARTQTASATGTALEVDGGISARRVRPQA